MSVHEAMELVINYKNLIVGSMFRCLLLALLLMFSVSTIVATNVHLPCLKIAVRLKIRIFPILLGICWV